MLVSWSEMARSPGHAFYDKLQSVLIASEFDLDCPAVGPRPPTWHPELSPTVGAGEQQDRLEVAR